MSIPCPTCGNGCLPDPVDLVDRLRAKADEIDRAVSRDKDDRDAGNWNEIEYLREAADEIARLRKMKPAEAVRDACAALAEPHSRQAAELIRAAPTSILSE